MLLYVALSIAFVLILSWVLGRYAVGSTLRNWDLLLTPSGERAVADVQSRTALDGALLDAVLREARSSWCSGDTARAGSLLEAAHGVVAAASPDRLTRLRQMSACTRMVLAMMPLPPVAPLQFRRRELATIAGFGLAVHHVLISTKERFLLRLQVLGLTTRMIARAFASSRVLSPESLAVLEDAVADWKTLDAEHVQSFSAIVRSLAAEPRHRTVPEPVDPTRGVR